MTIYCDESGGLNAGAMTFAAVMLSSEAAAAIHARFRAVTGLRGELKGSRISLTERAYLLELFDRAGGRAWVAVARRETLAPPSDGKPPSDLALLEVRAVAAPIGADLLLREVELDDAVDRRGHVGA